ncbi:MAG: NAD-dependent epimerase/dehydratase family protein [candidate division KSB1 bacterium]|jgi:nucleoside-diphosphate-sugar epimerase|nr:NAD-dependent epimerase/dehydratase family protein [candidate division KSB1 bacterium]
MNSKVLVTGATGFTGGYLAEELANRGYKVRALSLPDQDISKLNKLDIEVVTGDLTKKETLTDAVKDIDVVYHIAAIYREQNVPNHYFYDVNVGGTKNLLESAQEAGVKRFVHCSTVGVQGEIKDPPAKENAPYNPGDVYQKSKVEGEKLALEFFKENNIEGVVFRPVGILGPGDTRFLKIFKWVNSGKFRMIGNGEVLYHLTYVKDLVEGIILCGEKKEAVGEIFTLGGKEYVTLNEFVKLLSEVLDVPEPKRKIPVWPVWSAAVLCEALCYPLKIQPPIYRRRMDFFTKDRAFDISKAKEILGYNPSTELKTALKMTAAWYKEQNLL